MFDLNPYKKQEQKEIGKNGVEAEFTRTIKSLGGKAYKFVSEMNRGVSDRIVFIYGQVWFVEVKVTKGKLTPLQESFRETCKQFKANHFVVYGVAGIKEFITLVKGENHG